MHFLHKSKFSKRKSQLYLHNVPQVTPREVEVAASPLEHPPPSPTTPQVTVAATPMEAATTRTATRSTGATATSRNSSTEATSQFPQDRQRTPQTIYMQTPTPRSLRQETAATTPCSFRRE